MEIHAKRKWRTLRLSSFFFYFFFYFFFFFQGCLKVRTTVRFDGSGNIQKKKKMKTVALYLSWELEYWIKISWIEKKEKKEQFNQLVYYEIVA